jgi:hypothetical protein
MAGGVRKGRMRSRFGSLITLEESESWGGDVEKSGEMGRDGERWGEDGLTEWRTGLEMCTPHLAASVQLGHDPGRWACIFQDDCLSGE